MALTKIPGSLLDTASGINGLIYPTSDGTAGQFLKTDGSGNLSFATVTGYTDSDVETYLDSGTSTPTFSTATVSGTLTVVGDLDLTGDINSYNVTDLDITDQTITLGAGQTEALSGGSGIIVDGSGASILWDETNTEWDFNNSLNVAGNIKIETTGNPIITNKTTGAGNNPVFRLQADTNYWDLQSTFSNTNDELFFMYNGSTKMAIDNSGNVGIASVPSGEAAAAHVLRLGDRVTIAEYDDGSNPEQFNLFHNASSSETYRETGYATNIQQRNGDITFKTAPSGTAGAAITFDDRLKILNNGDVGIGTPTPGQKLDINGNTRIHNGTSGTSAKLIFKTTDNADESKYIRMASYWNEYSGNSNEGHHFIDSASTSLLKIFGNTHANARRIGMGTEAPSGKLHVATGLEANNVYFTTGASGGTGYDVSLNMLGGANNSEMSLNMGIDGDADRDQIKAYQGNLFFRANNNQRYQITSAGRHVFWGTHQGDSTGHFMFTNQGFDSATTNNSLVVQNGNTFIQIMAWTSNGARIGTRVGGWSTTGAQVTYLVSADATFAYGSGANFYLANGTAITSDERLKKNIVSTPDGQLAKINALRPVSFDWKDERKDSGEGFIAQEVEAIIPEAVAESEYAPDPDDDTRDFEGNVKSIKDGVLLSRLVKAIQELSAELDAAKARITELENA